MKHEGELAPATIKTFRLQALLLAVFFLELDNKIWQACARQHKNAKLLSLLINCFLVWFFCFCFLLQMPFTVCSGVFGDIGPPLTNAIFFFKTSKRSVRILLKHNGAKYFVAFQNSPKPRWKNARSCSVGYAQTIHGIFTYIDTRTRNF